MSANLGQWHWQPLRHTMLVAADSANAVDKQLPARHTPIESTQPELQEEVVVEALVDQCRLSTGPLIQQC